MAAYVKIAEGCDYKCAFCIIPALRGPQRSRTVADVVRGFRREDLFAAWTTFLERVGGDGPVALVLDAVQDPGNVGTLIRTAFALGAAGALETLLRERGAAAGAGRRPDRGRGL